MEKKIKNPIVKVYIDNGSGNKRYQRPVIIDLNISETEVHIKDQIFSFSHVKNSSTKEMDYFVRAGNSMRGDKILDKNRAVSIDIGESIYGFELKEDFVKPDNNRFKKFIIFSIYVHVIVGIAFGIHSFINKKNEEQLRIRIDQDRLQAIMAKLNKKKLEPPKPKVVEKKIEKKKPIPPEKKVVKKPEPKPKPKPKVKPKPRPKPKIAKKPVRKIKKKTKKKAPVSLHAVTKKKNVKRPKPKGPPRRLVVRKGPPKVGAVRKTKKLQRSTGIRISGGGKAFKAKAQKKKAMSSLAFLSSSGKSSFSRPMPSVPNNSKSKKYSGKGAGVGMGVGGKKTKSYLSQLATTATGNSSKGPITTRGARTIATGNAISEGAVFGQSRGKSLNQVQGKVAVSRLQDYGPEGGAFAGAGYGGGGMEKKGKGRLSDSAIEKTLAKYLHKLQYCYEKSLLYDATLAGTLWMKWNIKVGGRVSGVKVVKSQLKNKKLYKCITSQISKIRFPSPKGGSVIVKYPFKFSSSSL